ncbi:hypothetical protein CDR68_23205 [Salmonella enterica]|nr:hypothetical protein [Salmonella enterica]
MKVKNIFFMILFIWMFLPSTLFIDNEISVFDVISPDKKFKVAVYHTRIISPYSLYKFLKNQDYYFVLYNVNGTIKFKPSIFYGTSEIAAYDSIEFMYGDRKLLLYPTGEGYASFWLD